MPKKSLALQFGLEFNPLVQTYQQQLQPSLFFAQADPDSSVMYYVSVHALLKVQQTMIQYLWPNGNE